jgi:hypothetical protein
MEVSQHADWVEREQQKLVAWNEEINYRQDI